MALSSEDSLGSPSAVRLPYLTRPRLVIGFATVTVAAIVAAFIVGANASAAGDAIEDASTVQIPVTANVEQRVVAPTRTYSGVVTTGDSITVPGVTPDGAFSAVVVSTSSAAGDAVTPGASLGEVSGRPIFPLRSPLPLYRDLREGDRGADVLAVQQALSSAGFDTPGTSVMDRSTLRAIRAMYDQAGYRPPGWPGLPYLDAREIVIIPTDNAQVLTIAAAGALLDGTHPFATIQLTPDFVRARVGVIDEDSFQPGTTVQVTGPNGFVSEGQVARISEFRAGSDALPTAGFDIDVTFVDSPTDSPKATTPVSISAVVSSEEVLAVPLIAIRQDADGAFVVLREESDGDVRVAVTVTSQADGWAGIESSDARISEGATVAIR